MPVFYERLERFKRDFGIGLACFRNRAVAQRIEKLFHIAEKARRIRATFDDIVIFVDFPEKVEFFGMTFRHLQYVRHRNYGNGFLLCISYRHIRASVSTDNVTHILSP